MVSSAPLTGAGLVPVPETCSQALVCGWMEDGDPQPVPSPARQGRLLTCTPPLVRATCYVHGLHTIPQRFEQDLGSKISKRLPLSSLWHYVLGQRRGDEDSSGLESPPLGSCRGAEGH